MGEFYKTPHFPIWVIGSSSHYTILFCPDPRIVQDSEEEALYKRAQRAFKVGTTCTHLRRCPFRSPPWTEAHTYTHTSSPAPRPRIPA